MRLPDNKSEIKRVHVTIRVLNDAGQFKKGEKSKTFMVLDCTPEELAEFFQNKLKELTPKK